MSKEIKTISLTKIEKVINDDLMNEKKAIALTLYNEVVFMQQTLTNLKQEINNNGVIENFKNGKQDFIRESQALKSYNTTIKNYNKCVKDLYDILYREQAKNNYLGL